MSCSHTMWALWSRALLFASCLVCLFLQHKPVSTSFTCSPLYVFSGLLVSCSTTLQVLCSHSIRSSFLHLNLCHDASRCDNCLRACSSVFFKERSVVCSHCAFTDLQAHVCPQSVFPRVFVHTCNLIWKRPRLSESEIHDDCRLVNCYDDLMQCCDEHITNNGCEIQRTKKSCDNLSLGLSISWLRSHEILECSWKDHDNLLPGLSSWRMLCLNICFFELGGSAILPIKSWCVFTAVQEADWAFSQVSGSRQE